MSLLNDASIVIVPSGYKAGKVYSVKPTDGSGDLSFTRALQTATRVGPNGLIEKVRTNLVLQSVWPSIGAGVAPTSWGASFLNFSAGPLAGQLLCNTSANRGFITQSVSLVAGQFALSVFVDTVTITNPVLSLITIFGSTNVKFYEDGIEVVSSTNIVAGKRYATVGTVTTGSFTLRVGSGVTTNATANYVISRPQLESSDFGATPYIPTTSVAVSVGMLANVPRLDYTGGGCPKLLLEPQRTNLVTFSEQINNAAWTKTSATITANNAVSPAGFLEADTLTDVADNLGHLVVQNITIATSAIVTISVYIKKNVTKFAGFRLFVPTNGVGVGRFSIVVDLDTGVITSTLASGETIANLSFSVVDAGNGWYRARISGTSPVGTASLMTWLATTGTPVNDGFATQTYVGNGQSVHVWGWQAEIGSFATSYIPTLGAAVTRSADAASKTGISALIGQTEGTLFAEFTYNGSASSTAFERIIAVGDGTSLNRITVIKSNTNSQLFVFVGNGGVTQVSSGGITGTNILGTHKVAFAYKTNDFAVHLDGTLVFSSTSGIVPTTSNLYVGVSEITGTDIQLGGTISQALLFKTRLTNAALAELTA